MNLKKYNYFFWVTGLSGAGKSTFSKSVCAFLDKNNIPHIYLDGDHLRSAIASDLQYSKEDRKIAAFRYARLCQLIASQKMTVVCSTISMFDEVREFNRLNNENYIEIFVDTPMEILKNRNQKKLYSSSQATVGIEIVPELPKNSSYIIQNDESKSFEQLNLELEAYLKQKLGI